MEVQTVSIVRLSVSPKISHADTRTIYRMFFLGGRIPDEKDILTFLSFFHGKRVYREDKAPNAFEPFVNSLVQDCQQFTIGVTERYTD